MIKGNLGKLEVGDGKPIGIVGVVNLSSDSFFEESIASSSDDLSLKIRHMIEEGVDCIDIGAQSTRPVQIYGGEGRVDAETELDMIKKSLVIALDITSSYDNIEISIDTTRSIVAEYALKKGIRIINDISGFKKDNSMAKIIGDHNGCAVLRNSKWN
ncbi:MAG: dihydropteroate synthase [Candidatus Heimdallarchaeaceae archaeon]